MNQGPRHDDDRLEQAPPRGGPPGLQPRRPSWRAVLTLLAGGGLTAGLGPLASGASGAEAEGTTGPSAPTTTETTTTGTTTGGTPPPTSTTPTTTGSTTTTTSTSAGEAPRQGAQEPSGPTSTTTTQPGAGTPEAGRAQGEAPIVVIHRRQRASPGGRPATASTEATSTTGQARTGATGATGVATPAAGSGNVAPAPQLIAGQAGLAALLAGSQSSAQALDFYRIPLFLLPIYRAAAIQYDVPWPILAAINEIETNYGTDLSVSSAGAEGWMQFEPATWLQYGVDALNAGYADPYNPVDAIFAAARYLNAAGAATNLHGAILAYNHSEAYVESVLLRAKLIAAYPGQVIATLTGLIDGRPPVTGRRIGWTLPPASAATPATPALPPTASATAGASSVQTPPAAVPSSSAAPSPGAVAGAGAGTTAGPLQLADVTSEPHAAAVAVQDGRVVKLGYSRRLGRYVILQDVYGDLFTYAHLASIALTYAPARTAFVAAPPTRSSTATGVGAGGALGASPPSAAGSPASGRGKVRVFARPGNPDAQAALSAAAGAARLAASHRALLRAGAVVPAGTVLGRVAIPPRASDGHLRFAIRPTGDAATIDPRPILANWTQLDAALHPRGAKGHPSLLGATASDVFMLSKSQLERAVLADPGVGLSACSRHQVASGAIDRRALALLAFLSRSGLKPSVGTLPCEPGAYATGGYVLPGHGGDALAIVAVNGVPIAGHQGAGTITDTTIRTLLTLQGQNAPLRIVSLMGYPGAPSTQARADHGDYIEIVFTPAAPHAPGAGAGTGAPGVATTAEPPPVALAGGLTPAQWEQLFARIAALPAPTVAAAPSAAAIPDGKGTAGLAAGGG